MSHEEFKPDDIFINRVKTHPDLNFFIYDSEVTINNHQNLSASNDYATNVAKGHLSLFELNLNRVGSTGFATSTSDTNPGGLIFPYVRNASPTIRHGFRNQIGNSVLGKRRSLTLCNDPYLGVDFDQIQSGSYPMSASIKRILTTPVTSFAGYNPFAVQDGELCVEQTQNLSSENIYYTSGVNTYVSALLNPARKYVPLSKHFCLTGTLPQSASLAQNLDRDLVTSTVNLVDIPSIFYGSSVKKGSVNLKYYITGTLLAECSDTKRNGELIETTGSNTGQVVGLVMYDEGILLLTASHSLGSHSIKYGTGGAVDDAWTYFGCGANDGNTSNISDPFVSASFNISCKGTSYVNSMTLFCHANKNKLDYSNNPTFIDLETAGVNTHAFTTSSYSYSEKPLPLKNIVSSSFLNYSASYEKTTYLSKIGIYDEEGNLIMIASMAKPIKKKVEDEYTFKLTLDI